MTRLSQITRPTTAALLAAALLAATPGATPAFGQVQAQGGNAHDANQQVGSGGYNAYAEQPDYNVRNLLVTGNVGGGRAFQGSIGYSAPGTFQGSLGSDRLFNFKRDSIYSAPGAINYGATQLGDRVIVTRPTTSVPGYQVNTGTALSTRSSYDPRSGVLTFRLNGGGLVALTGVNDVGQLGARGGVSGLIQTPSGLIGIDRSTSGLNYNPLDANTGGNLTGQRPGNNPSTQPIPDTFDPDDTTTDPSIAPGLRIDGTRDSDPINNATTDLNVNSYPLAITLGSQVQSVMARKLAGLDSINMTSEQAKALRQTMYGAAGATAPGQQPKEGDIPNNPYDKLVADILAQAKDKAEGKTPTTADPDADTRPRWQKVLEEPEQEVLDAKRKAREAALRISLGMTDENGNPDFEQELPTIDPNSELGKLLSELDYELPRVKTLAGEDANRINSLMTRGEQELQAGRYLMAETVYKQIVRETRGDALAKAGLIHSQMGAGMIRSAAFNLRGLFSEHPELIALKYDAKLLPANDRLAWLQGQVQKMMNEDLRTADPALILAYLGYQLDAKSLVEYGLSVAEAQAPRDPLMPVLRRIWLEGEDAKDGDKKDADVKSKDAKPAPAPAEGVSK